MVRRVTRTSSQDLKRLILGPTGGKFFRPLDSYNEVVPGVLLGDAAAALSTLLLKELGVTHVLNAAHGRNAGYYAGYVSTSPSYYSKVGIKFLGIPALDIPSFYLRSYFNEAADFIDDAVRNGGKVLVHCQCGISRSASLIAAYMMLKKAMTAEEAIATIRNRRSIFPNQGFLSQLCDFDYDMKRKGDLAVKPTRCEDEAAIRDTLRATQKLPPFTFTPYPAKTPKCSVSGYRLSTPFDEFERKHQRARSEERLISDYRARSHSPVDSYRAIRASSIGPTEPSSYERASSPPVNVHTYSRLSPSTRASYSLTGHYSDYNYYVKSRYPSYPYYQPYKVSPESTKALLSLAEDTKRDLSLRERTYPTPKSYDSYFSTPSYSKASSYSTRTPSYENYNYSPYSYRSYTRYPVSSNLPSVLKYPSLMSSTLYSRILKA